MLAVRDSRWTRRHHQGQSARSTTLEREPSPGGQVMILPFSTATKQKEWPTGRNIPPREVEQSGVAPQPTRTKALSQSPGRPGSRSVFAVRKDVSGNQEIREICRAPGATFFGRD